jgi:PAS domain S-box-containing protein
MMAETQHQETIMIVDDTPANLKLLGEILKDHGYRVIQFPKPLMALEAAVIHPPSLFLLDIMMPDVDGYELSKRIKMHDHLRAIPVIFISAATNLENKIRAFSEGGVDYITKPFESKEVLARVDSHITLRNTQLELERYKNHLETLVKERTADLYQAERVAKLGSWKYDFKSKDFSWSPQTYQIFGWKSDTKVQIETVFDTIHPLDRLEAIVKWDNIIHEGSFFSEHRIFVDNAYKWVRVIAEVQLDKETQQPLILIGTVQDIHKNRELEIRVAKLSKAIEQSPASIVITDTAGTIEYVNPAFCSVTGYEEPEVVGKNPRILNSGFQDPNFYREMWDSLTNGETWIGELANKKKNGEIYWERSVISPITNDKGQITNYVAIKENITERKLTQTALMESEARFRSIFEENASIMYVIDAENGNFVDVNPTCLHFYKWDKQEMLNMNIRDINVDKELIEDDLQQMLGQNTHHGMHQHIDKVGNVYFMEVFCGTMQIKGKRFVHVISHDVTDRISYYNTILEQIDLLKNIAWTQSHILRAPVVRLVGLIDLLQQEDYSSFSKDELLNHIKDATDEIDTVIRDISDKSTHYDELIIDKKPRYFYEN